MRAEHHQCYHHLLGAFASTVAACKSSRRHIFSHICAQLLISAYGVSFVHLVMKHLHFFSPPSASELGAFPINQNLLTSLLNTSALPYCSSGTTSGSLLVLRWHTFTTSIFIPINKLNFCLSHQKAAQLIHFFPSYSMKLQSTKLS